MIEAGAAVEKTCVAIERKYETVIQMIDKHIKTAIGEGQFSIHLTDHDLRREIGVYLNLKEINSIIRLFDEHGYTAYNTVSGDINISW